MKKYEYTDGVLNILQDLDLSNQSLSNIPVKIGDIHGGFDISNNNFFILNNMPSRVFGSFTASNNNLITLNSNKTWNVINPTWDATTYTDFVCTTSTLNYVYDKRSIDALFPI